MEDKWKWMDRQHSEVLLRKLVISIEGLFGASRWELGGGDGSRNLNQGLTPVHVGSSIPLCICLSFY